MELDFERTLLVDPSDPAAWAELLDCYKRRLLGQILRRGGGEQAEDILQEVWVRFYRALLTGRVYAPFEPLLVTITRNTANTILAREQNTPVPVDIDDRAIQTLLREEGDIEACVLAWDLQRFVRFYKNQGNRSKETANRQLLCFLMCTVRDVPPAAMAARLGVPENTVHTWLRRIRRALRAWVGENDSRIQNSVPGER